MMSRVFGRLKGDIPGWFFRPRNVSFVPVCLFVFFLGCLSGWVAGGAVHVALNTGRTELMAEVAKSSDDGDTRAPEQLSPTENLLLFVESDPFGVPEVSDAQPDKQKVETVILTEKDMRVWGTIPGIGAWLEVGDKTSFVLVGQKFAGYVLDLVQRDRIELSGGGKKYLLNLLDSKAAQNGVTKSASKGKPDSRKSVSGNGLTPATPDKEGFLSREKVNELLMNPYDELQKVLLVPVIKNGKPAGIQVQSIHQDSILATLGVSKGDVVQSVNGIEIRNMGDIANAINSLMNCSHFDVSVSRGQQTVHLKYSVR